MTLSPQQTKQFCLYCSNTYGGHSVCVCVYIYIRGTIRGVGGLRTILRAKWWKGGPRGGNSNSTKVNISAEGHPPGARFTEGNAERDLYGGGINVVMCSCVSVVEHCVSSAKGCGFNSQGTRILTKKIMAWLHCKSLWIKVSAKCINVNVMSRLDF